MKNIKLLFIDVDGTLTDGKIYIGPCGEMMKAFHVRDGYAIHNILPEYDIIPVIITGRKSDIIEIRCAELGVDEVYQECMDKKNKLLEVVGKYQIKFGGNQILKGIAYFGDDIPDLECMQMAEVSGCPADAVTAVKNTANYVCQNKGGDGALREFVEWILEK